MKRYLAVTLIIWLSSLALYVGSLCVIDPFQVFHKPWLRDPYIVREMRVQAKGIIDQYEFDAAIVGTSMAANFMPGEASRIFNRHFVNISLDGSFMIERSVVLDYLFRKKKMADIIYSLDGYDQDSLNGMPIEPYVFLYDNKPFNDLQLYTSFKCAKFLFCRNALFPGRGGCEKTTDLEHATEWGSKAEHARRFGGLNQWLNAKNNNQVSGALKKVSNAIRTIEEKRVQPIEPGEVQRRFEKRKKVINAQLIKYFSAHPSTTFYLYFPPYSRLRYAIHKQSHPGMFEIYLDTIKWMVHEAGRYKNVEVYGFDDMDFPDDIANYKDTSHFHQRINSKILAWMKAGQHRLTASNVDAYISTIDHKAANYRIDIIGDRIAAYLGSSGKTQ